MAKKAATPVSKKSTPVAAPAKVAAPVIATSPVRNSPVPKVAPKAAAPAPKAIQKQVTHDDIARRAYEIYSSGTGGSEMDNWCRAERELRAGL